MPRSVPSTNLNDIIHAKMVNPYFQKSPQRTAEGKHFTLGPNSWLKQGQNVPAMRQMPKWAGRIPENSIKGSCCFRYWSTSSCSVFKSRGLCSLVSCSIVRNDSKTRSSVLLIRIFTPTTFSTASNAPLVASIIGAGGASEGSSCCRRSGSSEEQPANATMTTNAVFFKHMKTLPLNDNSPRPHPIARIQKRATKTARYRIR